MGRRWNYKDVWKSTNDQAEYIFQWWKAFKWNGVLQFKCTQQHLFISWSWSTLLCSFPCKNWKNQKKKKRKKRKKSPLLNYYQSFLFQKEMTVLCSTVRFSNGPFSFTDQDIIDRVALSGSPFHSTFLFQMLCRSYPNHWRYVWQIQLKLANTTPRTKEAKA